MVEHPLREVRTASGRSGDADKEMWLLGAFREILNES